MKNVKKGIVVIALGVSMASCSGAYMSTSAISALGEYNKELGDTITRNMETSHIASDPADMRYGGSLQLEEARMKNDAMKTIATAHEPTKVMKYYQAAEATVRGWFGSAGGKAQRSNSK